MYVKCQDDFLFLLSHCPFLSHKEKWRAAIQAIPDLIHYTHAYNVNKPLSSSKNTAFQRYIKDTSILQLKDRYAQQQIQYVHLLSKTYPYSLRQTFEPPFVLFFKGNDGLFSEQLLGVVGARECSEYGEEVLDCLLPPLIDADIVTVSGLARGIDTIVHKKTREFSGQTVAVIGTGLMTAYPRENKVLQEAIAAECLLISEYPFDTPPRKHHFPMRNRIISGLSRGVLVIEAKARSGSLITARMALEEGRDVFAVPGPISSELSAGCHNLIKLGAIPCTSGNDILTEWNGTAFV